MATVTIYPTADFIVGMSISGMNEENQSHQGMDDIYTGGGEVISAELITNVITANGISGQSWGAWAASGKVGTAWYIRRLVLSFSNLHNTTHASDLPNSTVTGVSVSLYGYGDNQSTGRGMSISNHYSSAPSAGSDSPPSGFDAYTFGNTGITSAINMSNTDQREEFAFTSAGVTAVQSAIDGTGNFTFGIMDSAVDYAYSEGSADDNTYIGSSEESATGGTGVYLSNYSGTTRDPRIIITYTPAASGYGHESIGVASANISKINAVATANISKFIGV